MIKCLLLLKYFLFISGWVTMGVVGCGNPTVSDSSLEDDYTEEDPPSSTQFNGGFPPSTAYEEGSSESPREFPSAGANSDENESLSDENNSSSEEETLSGQTQETGSDEADEEVQSFIELGDESDEAESDTEHSVTEDLSDGEQDEFQEGENNTEEFEYECTNGEEEDCITSCGSTGTRICSKQWGPCVPPVEICNGVDDDCDGTVDINAEDSTIWYEDLDNDGFGNAEQSQNLCTPPINWVSNGDDCNDEDSSLTLDCSDPFDDYGICGGYDLSIYESGNLSQPELHVLGVYEPISNGTIHVDVTRPTPMVLALSSYEPVEWNLQVSPQTTIFAVLINGYHTQSIVGLPAGIPVEIRSHEQTLTNFGAACGYQYPYTDGQGCDTNALVEGLEQHTRLQLTSFAGCYQKSSFTLE